MADDLTARLREASVPLTLEMAMEGYVQDAHAVALHAEAADRIDALEAERDRLSVEIDRQISATVDALAERDAVLAEVRTLRDAANRVNRAWLRGDIDGPDGEGPAALLALHRAADTEEAKSDG